MTVLEEEFHFSPLSLAEDICVIVAQLRKAGIQNNIIEQKNNIFIDY